MSENMNTSMLPDNTSQKEHLPEERKIIIHDFDYFRQSILWNLKENFFSSDPDKGYREDMLKSDFQSFTTKIEMLQESISKEYPDYSDFAFMDTYIRKTYTALYTKENLSDIFESVEVQEKFFILFQKYFFGNYGRISLELGQQYPKKEAEFLTPDEKAALLKEYNMPEEEQKRLWIWVDEDATEE